MRNIHGSTILLCNFKLNLENLYIYFHIVLTYVVYFNIVYYYINYT